MATKNERSTNLREKIEKARKAGGGVLTTGITPSKGTKIEGKTPEQHRTEGTGGTSIVFLPSERPERQVQILGKDIPSTPENVRLIEEGRKRTEQLQQQKKRQAIAQLAEQTKVAEQAQQTPYSSEYTIPPEVQAGIRDIQEKKAVQQTKSKGVFAGDLFTETPTAFVGPPKPPVLTKEIQAGIRDIQEKKAVQQTKSKGVFAGEKEYITPSIEKGIPVFSNIEKLGEEPIKITKSIARGVGKITTFGYKIGYEFGTEETKSFETAKKVVTKEGLKLVTDPDVIGVSLVGVATVIPAPILYLAGGGLAFKEAVKFAEKPSYQQVGLTLFYTAPLAFAKKKPEVVETVRQLIEVKKSKEVPLTKKEQKFIDKFKVKRTPEEIRALESQVGRGMVEDAYLIDISSLKQKQIDQLLKLQKEKKIESQYEIATESEKIAEVGLSFKSKRGRTELNIMQDVGIGEKFLSMFKKATKESRAVSERAEIAKMKELTSTELEAKIRAEMQRTGKSAKTILEEMIGKVTKETREQWALEERISKSKSKVEQMSKQDKKKLKEMRRDIAKDILNEWIEKKMELGKKKDIGIIIEMQKTSKYKKLAKQMDDELKNRVEQAESSELSLEELRYTMAKLEQSLIKSKGRKLDEFTKKQEESKPNLKEFGGFQSMDRQRQKLILIEEEQVLRGLKPIEEVSLNLQQPRTISPLFINVGTQAKPITTFKTETTPGLTISTTSITGQATSPISATTDISKSIIKSELSTMPRSKTLVDTSTVTSQDIVSQLRTKLTQETALKQDTLLRQDTILRQEQILKTPNPIITPTIKLPDFGMDYMKRGKVTYTAEVRREGKFKSIGIFQDIQEAFSEAKRIVSTTAAASLRVRGPTGFVGTPFKLSDEQFFRSKKEEGVFIERREKRIKSPGEIREITMKGIATQRMTNSNKKGGLFGKKRASKGVFSL